MIRVQNSPMFNPVEPTAGRASGRTRRRLSVGRIFYWSFLPEFNIVEAPSLDAATKPAEGCPLLKAGRRIVVYEAFSAT